MKTSSALSILLFLAGTEALPQRSTHDSLLERNFKNVLSGDEKAALAKRDPQGPASNPGEFTNVGLSNANPANFVPEMGDDGMSQSTSDASQSATTITSSASLSSVTSDIFYSMDYFSYEYGDSGKASESSYAPPVPSGFSDLQYPPSSAPDASMTSSRRHHYHTGTGGPRPTGHHHRPCKASASGSSCMPEPTGHHRHHNGTGRWHHGPDVGDEIVETEIDMGPDVGDEFVETEMDMGPDVGDEFVETEMDMGPGNVVTVHETLWQYNGTGWNHTDIPLPSGTITLPPTTASGAVGTGTGMPMMGMNGGEVPIDNGFAGPAFMFNAPRPGFVGPKEEEKLNEGVVVMEEKRRWLSGIF